MLKEIKNKRGDASDILVLLIVVFFLAVSFIVMIYVNDKITGVIQNTVLNSTSIAPNIIDASNNINSVGIQRGFTLMMIILFIGLIWSSFLVKIHPAFILLYVFVLVTTVFVAILLGNIYADVTQVEDIAALASNYPMIDFVMGNIALITTIIGCISMLIVFAKLSNFNAAGGGDI